MAIPADPIILLSFINTKLRDEYPTLDELCESLELDRQQLTKQLAAVGFEYHAAQNRFI